MVLTMAFLSGCNPTASSQTEVTTPKIYTRTHVAEQIEVPYDTVFDAMTAHYFKNFPELDREHTGPMQHYILEHRPKAEFVQMVIGAGNKSNEQLKEINAEPDNNPKYSDQEFSMFIKIAEPMASRVVWQEMNIYAAKFAKKDPIKLMLFEMDTDIQYSEYIRWVYGEVSEANFNADELAAHSHNFHNGDRIFAFRSSEDYWDKLWGIQGYLIVRNGKIHKVIVTLMN